MVDHDLLARLEALEPIALSTQAFRHVAHDHHPLSGAGARLHGGRWNPPGSFSTLYLGLDRHTTVNEFFRLVARQGRMPEDFLPRRMYTYEVVLNSVLDLRDPAARAAAELSDSELGANDAARCRQIGASAHYLGLEAVLAPSAAGEGTVLAVFFDLLRADSQVRDVAWEPWIVPPPLTP